MKNALTAIAANLAALDPGWSMEIGEPKGEGWITGNDLRDAHSPAFRRVLLSLGETLGTFDRRTIAASFALRYGWSAGLAIAAFVLHHVVPNIELENVSLQFGGNHTMFRRIALHRARGMILAAEKFEEEPGIGGVGSREDLLSILRHSLIRQAEPVVEALKQWSHFPPRATWGMISSSWGSQCGTVFAKIGNQCSGSEFAKALLSGSDIVAETQPHFYPVTCETTTRMYYRSSSCCRYYLLPKKQYCASCPLIPDDVRVERNVAWMKRDLTVS